MAPATIGVSTIAPFKTGSGTKFVNEGVFAFTMFHTYFYNYIQTYVRIYILPKKT